MFSCFKGSGRVSQIFSLIIFHIGLSSSSSNSCAEFFLWVSYSGDWQWEHFLWNFPERVPFGNSSFCSLLWATETLFIVHTRWLFIASVMPFVSKAGREDSFLLGSKNGQTDTKLNSIFYSMSTLTEDYKRKRMLNCL